MLVLGWLAAIVSGWFLCLAAPRFDTRLHGRVGFALGAAYVFGVSFALGAFFAGMMIRESDMNHEVASRALPIISVTWKCWSAKPHRLKSGHWWPVGWRISKPRCWVKQRIWPRRFEPDALSRAFRSDRLAAKI